MFEVSYAGDEERDRTFSLSLVHFFLDNRFSMDKYFTETVIGLRLTTVEFGNNH